MADAIIRENPFNSRLIYDKKFASNKPEVHYDEYDFVFAFYWDEHIPPNRERLVKGCYSARWIGMGRSEAEVGRILSACRGVVFPTHKLANMIVPHLDPETRWTVIKHGSDPGLFFPGIAPKEKGFLVLFAGHKGDKMKRYATIVKACRAARVRLRAIEDIPYEEMPAEYCRAHLCINFSEEEGGPMPLLEASLCQTPTMITRGIGHSNEIPCFPVSSEGEIIENLIRLGKNPELCVQMGRMAREVVLRDFTFEKMACQFASFFEGLYEDREKGEKKLG
jgi:glycosyltransferase involved in cell wall biosynthesis